MGYVSAIPEDGLVVSTTKGLWVYTIIAIPLVIVTMAIYSGYEAVNRRVARRDERTTQQSLSNAV